jgi:Dolichyl-phosphate-mannose-protein mannosyltransferase
MFIDVMRAAQARKRLHLAPYDIALCILLSVLVAIVALTYRSYGFTTDEAIDHLKAERVVEFLASLGRNSGDISKIDAINIYGAMPDVIALLLQKLIPALSFDARHLASALFGVVGIYYTYRLGRAFIAPAVGFFAPLFLACNPMWFGYMFINAKDIPFSAMLLAALYYCLSALTERDQSSWIWPKVGLAIGLLASTKLIGILVLGVVGILTLAGLMIFPAAVPIQINRTFIGRLFKIAISAIVGCLICFTVFWPQFFSWNSSQLLSIVRLFMNYENWNGYVQIRGQYFSFDETPWYYVSTYLVISMPLFLLALTAIGMGYGALKREPFVISSTVVCIVFLTYQALTGARVYNGYRHFIFLLPFMMIIAAYPIGFLVGSRPSLLVRGVTLAAVILAVTATAVSMYRLFPYQYSFYNLLVGGVQGADGRYYIDVWRSALREALLKIEELPDTRGVIRVYGSCGSTLNFAAHPRFTPTEKIEEADYIVALRRPCDPRSSPVQDLPVVSEIRRQGVLFATVYARHKM